jgi:two-component system, NtrC family, nitrogen regulation sensor histidine kinase GlnL
MQRQIIPSSSHQTSAELLFMNDVFKSPDSLIENITTAVMIFDDKMGLVSINAAGENMLSVSINKIQGQSPLEFLPDSQQFLDDIQRSLDEMHPYTDWGVELYLNSKKSITVGCIVTPVEIDDKKKYVIVELINANSFTQVMREETSSIIQDAARKSLKGIAHEIKNPLGGLRGAAQLLEKELQDKNLKEYTQIIISEADRLRNLVDRMLAHESRPHKSNINLHEVIEYVIDISQVEADEKLKINRDYDPSLPGLKSDKDQLIQVFMNVIRNALQAIASNGQIWVQTRIRRSCTIRQNFYKLAAEIKIMDDGPGIPEGIEREVFYPLITGRPEGTGLGLSIAQSLLQLNDGSISYERAPDRTIFTILLPLGVNNE